ncbi:uncharacterized protein KY384_001861 [Bacidia gigantensis]|uniref:uncharacterized protein n=1 Tax=Bacidia gigantensis TaxID=2732470 RepID=UPI001D05B832|nr:uncharacterized protein KY384_001861 [Bacidia gigantensis]KAG8533078.1 hypothetical protein KY384_001861 [Bacidia gigantensis]
MGKAGRFACIFTPMALTIASLVCLVLVGLGGTNRGNSTYNNLYFFRANTSNIDVDPSLINLPNNTITDKIVDAATDTAKQVLDVKDFYHIHLWNYCNGDFKGNDDNSSQHSSDHVDFCSAHTNQFWFNPVEVWGLNNTNVDKLFSKELRHGLDVYKTTTKWMFICYIVALISTIVEILVGFLALFSRLGSLATTIVSAISSLFIIGFALTATILYSVLAGTFNTALNKYNIHGSLGKNIYVATWIGVAFSLAAGMFWLFSSCCCSGRSDKIKGYDTENAKSGQRSASWKLPGRKQPYEYERMDSPFQGGMPYNQQHGAHQMNDLGNERKTAYEPFRHNA